ncbi:MAG TPA: biotin carboxylase N-terminal domain-containing protein [Acidimicrobiales bacterium]|nr:biotin carboxylase N-terminal domain-containing protein [Acidimicrobiales bacterium]
MTFSTLLVANRGEIARRVLRGARQMGLRTLAVYVEADADAPFVTDADQALRLSTSYLDHEAILAAAARGGADALHPGYGFLSENAEFAAQVEAAGLVWIGPPSRVIGAMGDKLAAKELAIAAGVPVIPSSENPKDAKSIGFPLIVKAAAGGGGKGMHVVRDASQLSEALGAARREAQSSFGDDRVFLERYLARSRHVEIQILGDQHGHLVHLGERDCSIQRRHQKLIEESPSPVVDDPLRHAMGAAALELARAIGYESAGTVEFLIDDETRAFYFLEVNTRLQVEHPVTEEVTGIDLVREQLRVAAGEELGYTQDDVRFSGHAIEARLCAEDPSVGFLPATGTLVAFEPSRQPLVRWESGVRRGSSVTVAFDPLLAKVIAHAPTRREAAATLALALERLHLGGVTTNRDFLAGTLRHEHFLEGDTTTDFIERFDPPRSLVLSEAELVWASSAGALWLQGERRVNAVVLSQIPSGWRNARLPSQRTSLRLDGRHIDVDYRARRNGSFDLGDRGEAVIHHWNRSAIDAEINGERAKARVTRSGEHLYVQTRRGTAHFEIVTRFEVRRAERTPGGLNAPMPGLILDVRVEPGQHVTAGETLVVMEAMKMEHVISAPSAGTVNDVWVTKGQQVDRDVALLTLTPSDAPQE